jgi:hypothetical protein
LARRYENLASNRSSIIKNELIKEVDHLKKIDDITYEIDNIKRVLNEQDHILRRFNTSIASLLGLDPPSGSDQRVHPASKLFDHLGEEAARVRNSVGSFNNLTLCSKEDVIS